jgi:hypothetical protein
VKETISLCHELQSGLIPVFLFLTHYESDTEQASTVYANIKHLFFHQIQVISKIKIPEIQSIIKAIMNDIYIHSLNSYFAPYFFASFSLSLEGGEEIRKNVQNYTPIHPQKTIQLINYNDRDKITSILKNKMEEEQKEGDEINVECEDSCSSEILPMDRDITFSNFMNNTETLIRIDSIINYKRATNIEELFFF